jgi:hypothetical protein
MKWLAELEFSEGSYGFNKSIRIKNKDGSDADLTGYTAGILTIKTFDKTTTRISVAVTISGSNVVWAINNGDTDYSGKHIGQLKITGSGKEDRTYIFDVDVIPKLD